MEIENYYIAKALLIHLPYEGDFKQQPFGSQLYDRVLQRDLSDDENETEAGCRQNKSTSN